MFLKPESLLACVEAMTAEQRIKLCQLLDPVVTFGEPIVSPDWVARNQPESVGPQPGSVEHDEVFGVAPDGFFTGSIPLRMVRPMVETVMPVADDEHERNTVRERWLRATERWHSLFGESQIPILRKRNDPVQLELVESVLYDKEHHGQDPVKCSCGCGYIGGCGWGKLKQL